VISAHWEEDRPTITHAAEPSLIYDYSGFPAEAYEIEYPALGEPHLANQLFMFLEDNGIEAVLAEKRGFDHGVFVPLKIMYPDADIPCIQVSLLNNLDPQLHIKMGEALAELNNEGALIIGSGFSFHNMTAFFKPNTLESREKNVSFEAWLIDTCSNKSITEAERTQRLINWEHAPFARYCHPREEHLLPLHVCYGSTQNACSHVFELNIMGKKSSIYIW
jgi:4,5-DOPA dioxygenase extradiol